MGNRDRLHGGGAPRRPRDSPDRRPYAMDADGFRYRGVESRGWSASFIANDVHRLRLQHHPTRGPGRRRPTLAEDYRP